LATELQGTASLLRSAHAEGTIEGPADDVPSRHRGTAAWVLREGGTNIPPHADPSAVTSTPAPPGIRLANDRPTRDATPPHARRPGGRDHPSAPAGHPPRQRRRARGRHRARGQRPDRDAGASRGRGGPRGAPQGRRLRPRRPLRSPWRPPLTADPAASPAAEPLRVILVDDEHLIRSALATMLSLEEDLEVLGEAGSVEEGARLAGSAQPDVAVVDLQLPDGDGL